MKLTLMPIGKTTIDFPHVTINEVNHQDLVDSITADSSDAQYIIDLLVIVYGKDQIQEWLSKS